MSKVLIYSQEDLDLILELEKEKNEELQQESEKQKEVISRAMEYINKYENIKAYYDEYNYDEDFKKELLDMLKEASE